MGEIASLILKVDSSGVNKASEDLGEFSKSAGQGASAATGFTDSVVSINEGTLKAVGGTTALTYAVKKLVSSLGSAAQSALQTYSHFEQMENGLATVFQSAEKGKAVFEDLRAFSFKTTFGVDELADAATQLYNVGMAEDEVKEKLAMLGDLAGGQKQKFADLVSVYGKIVSTGQAGSMQLQQLALRGIPIKQVLEEMGVEGTASAEQITAAFEKLTGEGGRFHDAMDSIIDTIEGKEGFLSDTLKEMGVNFAEASGLADAYKDGLDVVYGGVQALTDKLAEVEEKPVWKALFQGTLAATVGGVGVALTSALVPALGAVAAKMGIIATLSAIANPAALIGGAVAGVGLLALSKAVEYSKELNKEHDELVEKRNELQKLQVEGTATFEDQIELQRTQIALLEEARDKEAEGIALYGGDDDYYRETVEALEVERQKLAAMVEQKETMEKWARIYKNVQTEAQKLNALVKLSAENYDSAVKSAKSYYETKTYEGELAALNERIADAKKALQGELVQTKTWVPGLNAYQTLSTSASGYDRKALEAFLRDAPKLQAELYEKYHPKVKIKPEVEKSEFEKAVEDAQKALDSAELNMAIGIGSTSDLSEAKANLIRAELRKSYDDAGLNEHGLSTDQYDELLAKQKEMNAEKIQELETIQKMNDVYGYMSSKLTEIFEKEGMSAEVSETLGKALVNVVSTQIPNTLVSGFEAIGNALGEGADAGDALKQVMLNSIKTLLSQMSATCFQAGVMLIAQLGAAGLAPALALFALGGVSGIGAGVLGSSSSGSDYEQKEKEQLELMKALNDQYKSLYDAMREQEEYYLQKKRQITSTGINEGAGLTQVNDMILTPQGNFSTSPKDYIIATKDPAGLSTKSSVSMNVVINNSMGESANVTAQRSVGPDGQQELVVSISRKVAQDYAMGTNGWDYAIDANSARRRGRSLS